MLLESEELLLNGSLVVPLPGQLLDLVGVVGHHKVFTDTHTETQKTYH